MAQKKNINEEAVKETEAQIQETAEVDSVKKVKLPAFKKPVFKKPDKESTKKTLKGLLIGGVVALGTGLITYAIGKNQGEASALDLLKGELDPDESDDEDIIDAEATEVESESDTVTE